MKQETITRIKLTASDGKVLTNGTESGKEIYLADTENPANWYEVTEAEYEEIQSAIDGQNVTESEV